MEGLALAASMALAAAAEMTGVGETFPYPLYAKWTEAFKAKTGHSLNYQSIGSVSPGALMHIAR